VFFRFWIHGTANLTLYILWDSDF